jgi:hypothetical protein
MIGGAGGFALADRSALAQKIMEMRPGHCLAEMQTHVVRTAVTQGGLSEEPGEVKLQPC